MWAIEATKKCKLSVELEEQCTNQITFLQQVDKTENLKDPNVIRRAIYRYEKFWLLLAAEHPAECLSAPLDIEWVWHCHMLSPRAYSNDCVAITGTVVNHTLQSRATYDHALQKSQQLWNQKYQHTHEPFIVDQGQPYDPQSIEQFNSKITYDIVGAAERQNVFYYQISLPHFKDKKFLQASLLRYKKFLYLKTKLPSEFIVPCYDIDLVWHSHQLNPWAYKIDMMKIIGNLFNHDDNVTDRNEGSKLYNADMETRKHWKNTFNESFALFGAMYRGKPPAGFLSVLTPEEIYKMSTKKTHLSFDRIRLEFADSNIVRQLKNLKIIGETAADDNAVKRWFKVPKPNVLSPGHTEYVWSQIGSCAFDTGLANKIKIYLTRKKGFFSSRKNIGIASIDVLGPIESVSNACGGQISSTVAISSQMKLHADMQFRAPTNDSVYLFLEQGTYQNALIPEQIQTLWGPVNLERLPTGRDNHCQIASHRLRNHTGRVLFTARTIHSAPLMMSVVQIYYQDRMAAIGHLIASDQLPLPTQVTSKCIPSLNPRQGERAVLIKNNHGDWGIVTGKWVGYRKGIPGVRGTRRQRGKPGVPGSFGTLSVTFYNLLNSQSQTVTLGYLANQFTFNMGPLSVDLKNGRLDIKEGCTEIAENLALAFSVSVLHVLCVPRPSGWTEGKQVMIKPTYIRRMIVSSTPSDTMKFVRASGLLNSTPSNFYIRSRFGHYACAMHDHVGEFREVAVDLDAGEDGGDICGDVSDGDGGVGVDDGGDDGGVCAGCGGCGGCGGGGGGCGGGDSGGCGGGDSGGCGGGDSGGCGGGDSGGCGGCGGCGG